MAAAGAELLIVPNADPQEWGAWQHRQHSDMAPLRAVETGLWVARAASSGHSQIIDPAGRVKAELPFGAADVLVGDVELASPGTPYVAIGWLLAPLCLAFTAAFLVWVLAARFGKIV
jgi:apolipoprotein N-acyltransferase